MLFRSYVLMRSIKGDVSLSSLANIDLNGYTLDGSVRFGAEAPILAAGDLYIGSGTGGVITGRVYVDAPNAEVYHYGKADSVSIKAAAGYHFYGESKVSFWMQGQAQGTATYEGNSTMNCNANACTTADAGDDAGHLMMVANVSLQLCSYIS